MSLRHRALRFDAIANEDALGAIVPDVHLHDLSVAHHEAVDITVAFKRRTIWPFAVKRSQVVDDGLMLARHDVRAFNLLLDPFVAFGVEGGAVAWMVHFASAGEGEFEVVGDIAGSGNRIW